VNSSPTVFLSYTWSDLVAVQRIERALRDRGIAVFRDVDIPVFDRITEGLAGAVDGSALLLAFYSTRYPTRYACQWELTRAFLAARRLGDPADRVLVVNPEPDESHIAPIELTDAGYFRWRERPDLDGLVDRVAAKLAATGGVPLGAPAEPDDLSRLDPRVLAPRRFVGRYHELWAVHSALHGRLLSAVRKPHPHAVAVLKAPRGMGKTSTAEHYAFLFRDAYPGGVLWLSMAGGGRSADERAVLARFSLELRRTSADRLGLDLADLAEDRVRAVLGDHLTRLAQDVLVVVDDLPAGLTPAVLDQLVVPSARARTLLTARTTTPDWPAPAVELGGLTDLEVESLFGTEWPHLDTANRATVGRVSQRLGGHPLLLTSALHALSAAHRTGAAEDFADRLDELVAPEVDPLVAQVRALGPTSRLVLGFAAALAPAMFTASMVAEALVDDGRATKRQIGDAFTALAEHSLVLRADGGHRHGRCWRLHALVAEAAGRELSPGTADDLARLAARAVAARIGENAPPHLHTHALHLASNPAVPLEERLGLLRAQADVHDGDGDAPAARDAIREVLRHSGERWRQADVLTAARMAVAAADPEPALVHASLAIERAVGTGDRRSEYRARFVAAAAHDLRGHYAEADEVFHRHPDVLAHGDFPAWLSPAQRHEARVAKAAALRRRGEHRAALAVITDVHREIRREHPGGPHRGLWPTATVELARARLFNGETKRARADAESVVALFDEAERPRHRVAREAVAVAAEAELVVAFTDLNLTDERWRAAADRIGLLAVEAERWYGPDNAHTLGLRVLHAQALLDSAAPDECLRVLADTDGRIEAVLGVDHPLRLSARSVAGRARFAQRNWAHAYEILADVLQRQVAALGATHPDSLVTRFALGLAAAGHGEKVEALSLVSQTWRLQATTHGWWRENALEALAHQAIVLLPGPLFRLLMSLKRSAFGGKDPR
jgi:TIR domain-containing protein